MLNSYDPWQTAEYDCLACRWHGAGSELSRNEREGGYFELLCPACGGEIGLLGSPTLEGSRARWDQLSGEERKQVGDVERFQANFADRKLREPSQLPDIASPSFLLHWDLAAPAGEAVETLIRHGDTVVFQEPAIYEGYGRFVEVAGILRARYGGALRDLVPTEGSGTYLYGDDISSPSTVKDARQRIFSQEPATLSVS